jgi:hypothetical protein
MAIQLWICDGMDRATETISEIHAFDTDLCVEHTLCGRISEAEVEAGTDGENDLEWKACVLQPFSGDFRGVAVLSMDPDEALAWVVADGSKRDIVGSFLEIGSKLLEGVVDAAQSVMGEKLVMGPSRFREDSITGCLLSTHAPADTVAVNSTVQIRACGRNLSAQLHILVEPKSMSRLLRALSVSMH